jgi:ABC-type multidrug transport system fused ATPase/permease subunit
MVPQKQEEKDDSDTCNNTTIAATAAATAANTDNTDNTANKEQHSARQLSQGKLVLKEKQEQGTIKSRTWCAYFNAIGWGLCGSILFTYLLRESCKIGMEIWMASWADSETRKNKWFNQTAATDNTGNTGNTTTVGSTGMGSTTLGLSTREYMFGYLIWAGVALVASSVRSIGLLYAAVRAARKTFIGMVHAVTKAPMSWFDTTPQGRILNRVSSDTASVDERVPNTLRDTVDATVRIVGTLFLVAWFSPWFCLLLPLFDCLILLMVKSGMAFKVNCRMHGL